jgi:hypothetical protein
MLPLSGTASEEWHEGITFAALDLLGNKCTRGGADISMKLSKSAEREGMAPPIECGVEDKENGSYVLKWKSTQAGVYPIDVQVDGAHVSGSPIQLIVHSAQPSVEHMAVAGNGMVKAVAGIKAELQVRVADRFGNRFESSGKLPYTFGLILNPAGVQQTDKVSIN